MGQLRTHVFVAGVAASIDGTWYDLDYRFEQSQERRIMGTMNALDTVRVLASPTSASDANVVEVTIASTTGGTTLDLLIQGPYRRLRVDKVGANGAATVVGVV